MLKRNSMPKSDEIVAGLLETLRLAAQGARKCASAGQRTLREDIRRRAMRGRLAAAQLGIGALLLLALPYRAPVTAWLGPPSVEFDPDLFILILGYAAALTLLALSFAALLPRAPEEDDPNTAVAIAYGGARRLAEVADAVAAAIEDVASRHGMWAADCDIARRLATSIGRLADGLEPPQEHSSPLEDPTRREPRITIKNDKVVLTTANGPLVVRVINVSALGAAIEGNIPGVGIGKQVRLGRHHAKVVRRVPTKRVPDGFGLVFDEPLEPQEVRPDMVL